MRFFARDKMAMVEPDTALPGRSEELRVPERHEELGTPLRGPLPPGVETAIFGMGCFWGAERIFWQADGVYTTAVGYAGGVTPNPTYEEMLRLFWEGHDPTQGMRQGNDAGTQYRSLLMWNDESQRAAAEASREAYQQMLTAAGHGTITTELLEHDAAHPFYYAEDYHQQYLVKNPGGYCGLGGTGVACPVGIGAAPSRE